jgi:hypothetical protein
MGQLHYLHEIVELRFEFGLDLALFLGFLSIFLLSTLLEQVNRQISRNRHGTKHPSQLLIVIDILHGGFQLKKMIAELFRLLVAPDTAEILIDRFVEVQQTELHILRDVLLREGVPNKMQIGSTFKRMQGIASTYS